MSTRNKNQFNFADMLNNYLAESDTFRKLFEVVGKVSADIVQEKITQLARVRDPRVVHRGDYIETPNGRGIVTYVKRDPTALIVDEVHADVPGVGSVVVNMRSLQDRPVLVNGARFMGFDYFSDTLDDDDYARIYQFIGEYWPLSSGDNFVNFIGYANRLRLDIQTLWTEDLGDDPLNDFYPFLEPFNVNLHTPVWNDGKHYPTSHVQLEYSALEEVSTRKLSNIINMFYYLAPIHLVLERLVSSIDIQFNTYAAVHAHMDGFFGGELTFNSESYIEIAPLVETGFEVYYSSFLLLNGAFTDIVINPEPPLPMPAVTEIEVLPVLPLAAPKITAINVE